VAFKRTFESRSLVCAVPDDFAGVVVEVLIASAK